MQQGDIMLQTRLFELQQETRREKTSFLDTSWISISHPNPEHKQQHDDLSLIQDFKIGWRPTVAERSTSAHVREVFLSSVLKVFTHTFRFGLIQQPRQEVQLAWS